MNINKFAKTTIITYYKNNPILTSKCTKESFQVSLNINFIKYMFMWRSSITSIYRLLMPLAHKNIHQHKKKENEKKLGKEFNAYLFKCLYLSFSFSLNIHQHKRKNMRRSWVRNLMITCSNVYTYLSHFLLSFYYYYYI